MDVSFTLTTGHRSGTPVLHLWRVKYCPQTNHNCSKIRVTSVRNGDQFVKSYDSQFGDSQDQASYWLRQKGYTVIAFMDSDKDSEYYVATKEMKL